MTTTGTYKKALLAHPRLSDAATVTTTSEATTAEVEKLQEMYPTDVWIAPSVTSLRIDVDLGASPGDYRLFWLGFHNGGAGDTWTIKTDTTTAFSSPAYNSGALDLLPRTDFEDGDVYPYSHSHHLLAEGAERSERYVRIELSISSPKVPDGYSGADFFRAARLYIANPWQFPFHVKPGFAITPVEESARFASTFSGRRRVGVSSRDVGSMQFEVDYQSLDQLMTDGVAVDRLRGASSDVLAILDPDSDWAPNLTTYGLLSQESWKNREGGDFMRRYQIEGL